MTLQRPFASFSTVQLWRLLIVSGILLATLLVVPKLVDKPTLLLLLAVAIPATAAGLFLLQHLEWGLLLIIPVGLLIPFTVGTGTGTSLHAGVLMATSVGGLWIVRMVVIDRHLALRLDRVTLPLLLFMLVVLLAFLAGQMDWFSIPGAPITAQIGAVAVFLLSAGLFLAAAHIITDIKWLERMTWLFLFLGAVYAGIRISPLQSTALAQLLPAGATGSVFWIWLVALAAGQALFNRGLRNVIRLGLIGLVTAVLFIGIGQNRVWASGWMPPFVALMLIAWRWRPRLGWLPLLGVLALAISRVDTLLQIVSTDRFGTLNPWIARTNAWGVVLEATRPSMIFGLGPANYYYYVELFTLVGWDQGWNVRFNSHNQYVDIIAQVGIVGLVCFLWFAIALLLTANQLFRRTSNDFTHGYAAACVSGIAATLFAGILGDWILPFVYNVGIAGMRSSLLFWLFTGGMMSLVYMQSTDQSQDEAR